MAVTRKTITPKPLTFWDSPEHKLHTKIINLQQQISSYQVLCENLQQRLIHNDDLKKIKQVIKENEEKWLYNLIQFERFLQSIESSNTKIPFSKEEIQTAYTNTMQNYLSELDIHDSNIHSAKDVKDVITVLKNYLNTIDLENEAKVLRTEIGNYLKAINELIHELTILKKTHKQLEAKNTLASELASSIGEKLGWKDSTPKRR